MAPANPLPTRPAGRRRRASAALMLVASTLLGVLVGGCFTSADGRQPEPERIYFPTGLVVSPGRTTLYVANSDFDLAFSGGWIQALDLAALRRAVGTIPSDIASGKTADQACAGVTSFKYDDVLKKYVETTGFDRNTDPWLNPGPCSPLPIGPYVKSTALVGAFSSGLLLVHQPDGNKARLFVPVRGDPSITYFDVQDDRNATRGTFQLDCDPAADGFCSAKHRIGQSRDDSLRGIQLPADPVGIAATSDGSAIVSAHQTQQAASLLINDWNGDPHLAYFVSNLAPGPTEVATIPRPAFVEMAEQSGGSVPFEYRDGFALTFRAAGEVDLLRYQPDAGSSPARPFLTRATSTAVATNSGGFDSRGIAMVDHARRSCEAACAGLAEQLDCLVACAEQTPISVYVANRAPPSLLVGRIETTTTVTGEGADQQLTGAFDELFFTDTLPLTFGPSRVEVGQVVAADGSFEDRVFAVAFDSRAIFVVDPTLQRVEAVIHTGRGPHDIAIDSGIENGEPYSMLWVGHFTDSYLGVVDLDLRRPLTYAQMIATVGTPTPPLESK